MPHTEKTASEFMESDNGSYARLADHLNKYAPRSDGSRWTKDAVYHFCRTHSIQSKRRCKNQPGVGIRQRANTRKQIIAASIEALTASGRTITDIAPFSLKEITQLSGAPYINVKNNWPQLENELLILAGLPPKPRILTIIEDDE
ncbi:hypothetical protein D3879_04750 [Pseudomonas cavernicola]|uniref:Uncharacterized protein n=1 Tax=Pseudomonas cavernicola TaxID=2320866 RepID=A0A418XJF6_9PSED|nr:hypothetical protein [Pseudomonas cavernicola]RJG12600.1 hypothetical protein D3879_04750 [Pseudomonas cavernicola]